MRAGQRGTNKKERQTENTAKGRWSKGQKEKRRDKQKTNQNEN